MGDWTFQKLVLRALLILLRRGLPDPAVSGARSPMVDTWQNDMVGYIKITEA